VGKLKVYETVKISQRTRLDCASNSRIGDFTFIGCARLVMGEKACINRFCELQGRGTVFIGKAAQVASHASIVTSTDTPWGSMSDAVDSDYRRIKTEDVHIGDHAYIGPYATIMPGVTIGERAVVGAYSYIATDVEAGAIVHPRVSIKQMRRQLDPDLYHFFGVQEGYNDMEEEEIEYIEKRPFEEDGP
jgi:acetyltransferase-like isoleucine patch superfamily enzyme